MNICNEFYELYKKKVPRLIPYRGKVTEIPAQGKANWKRGLQRDAGPIFGGTVFILLIIILMPFLKYDYVFLAIVFALTIIFNFIIVGKIKSDAGKEKPIPSTAPTQVLLQPLRYFIFPTRKYIECLKIDTKSEKFVILDFGCGPGYYTIPLAQSIDGTVIAVDIREKMLKVTRERAKQKNIKNIKYIQSDSSSINLKDSSADIICMNLVLGEIVNLNDTIIELGRILKASGKISIMESIFDDHYMNIDEVKGLFENKGFCLELVEKKKTYYILEAYKEHK